jgi:hypothetical protein
LAHWRLDLASRIESVSLWFKIISRAATADTALRNPGIHSVSFSAVSLL